MKNFATIAAPLSSLLQKEKIWDFGEECKASFQQLKLALVEATTVQFPDPDVMFHVHTDWCSVISGWRGWLGIEACGLHKSEVDGC